MALLGPDGTELGQQVTPLDRAGLYVPGGKAAENPSSLLMNAIPAKVAGVRELVMVTPTPRGQKNPLVLAAAAIAGVDSDLHHRRCRNGNAGTMTIQRSPSAKMAPNAHAARFWNHQRQS